MIYEALNDDLLSLD